jgi:hypothetical protein
LKRLDEILAVAARISRESNALPERATLTLQDAILKWEFSAQTLMLQQKLAALNWLRLNASADLVPLIDGYQRTISTYLQRRFQAARTPETRMQVSYNSSVVAEDAKRELDLLDQRRKTLQPEQSLSVNSTTKPSR